MDCRVAGPSCSRPRRRAAAVDGADEVAGLHAEGEGQDVALLRLPLDDLEVGVPLLDEAAERVLGELGG